MERVLPRDAFNDANLLKCIGRLTLLIEDGRIPWLTYEFDGNPFDIIQDESDGSTSVNNIQFVTSKGDVINHYRAMNDRYQWPLRFFNNDSDFYIFDDTGECILDECDFE